MVKMDTVKKYTVLIAFTLVPFGFLSYGNLHVGHQYAITLAALLIMASLIRNNYISAFLTYTVTWLIFIFLYRMIDPRIPPMVAQNAFETVVFFIIGAVIFHAVTQSNLKNETFYNFICAAALLQCTIAISQRAGFDPILNGLNLFFPAKALLATTTLTGTMFNPNFLAGYLAVSLPFFFRPKWLYGLILLIPCLYLSNTTSAAVPAIIGACYFYHNRLTRRERWLSITGGAVVIAAYSCFQHSAFYLNPRWKDWIFAATQVRHDLFSLMAGFGPGAGWGKGYPMHNEWLQCLHQFGIIGLGLLAGYVATIYRGNRILFTAFIIAAINMFGNYSLHLVPSAFLIIIVAGLIEREKLRQFT